MLRLQEAREKTSRDSPYSPPLYPHSVEQGGGRGNLRSCKSVVKKFEKTFYFRMAKTIRNLALLELRALKRPLTLELLGPPR